MQSIQWLLHMLSDPLGPLGRTPCTFANCAFSGEPGPIHKDAGSNRIGNLAHCGLH